MSSAATANFSPGGSAADFEDFLAWSCVVFLLQRGACRRYVYGQFVIGSVSLELSVFAKNILFSGDLSSKLAVPSQLTDRQPLLDVKLPTEPSRPKTLELSRWKNSARVGFPTKSELVDPVKVGVLLHFFANHELLALELMALALLKFQYAPSSFRLGIAQTMLDEQKHLSSYIRKMSSVGIEFGDIPVNDFFWAQCASMSVPMDYVARMSMTFEQANLDFASYFRDVLVEIGDLDTASLLQTVLDDEIGHVKHGLTWFRRWKTGNSSDWEAFCQALGGELNPARAKGQFFHEEGRLKAGFCNEFINSLKVFSQSKGAPARISVFNPDVEEELKLSAGKHCPKPKLEALRRDLEPVMLFVLSQSDVLSISRALPQDFLLQLRQVGFDLPERLVGDVSRIKEFVLNSGRRISGVLSWATAPSVFDFAGKVGIHAQESSRLTRTTLCLIYSKAFALRLVRECLQAECRSDGLIDPIDLGEVVVDEASFDRALTSIARRQGFSRFIAKRPWSASGRHRIVGSVGEGCFAQQDDTVKNWFHRSWRLGEFPIVQPLFSRKFDFSVQGRVDCLDGRVSVNKLGLTRILNHPNGQYCGSVVGRFLSDEPEEMLRFWHNGAFSQYRGVEAVIDSLIENVGEKLASQGYYGAFGIDCFVFEDGVGQLKIHPMIELNPRHTMGRVALSIGKRMAPGRVGIWLHIPASWLESLGVQSFQELKERWGKLMPLVAQSNSRGVVISSGVLETTPASQCEHIWTCFVACQSLNKALEVLGISSLVELNGSLKTADTPVPQP